MLWATLAVFWDRNKQISAHDTPFLPLYPLDHLKPQPFTCSSGSATLKRSRVRLWRGAEPLHTRMRYRLRSSCGTAGESQDMKQPERTREVHPLDLSVKRRICFFYRRVFVCALRSAEDLLMRLNCEYTEIGRAFLRAERSAEVRGMRVGARAASCGAHPLPKNVHLCF